MASRTSILNRLKSIRVLLILALVVAYAGATAYSVMSDTSVRGLTVKIFSLKRFCPPDSGISDRIVTYNVTGSVWSTHSLRTSISNVQFTLAVDSAKAGTATGENVSFDPGNGYPFLLTFKDPSVDPRSLSSSPNVVLSLTALVSAGFASSTLTRSDSLLQDFGTTTC